MNEKEFNNCINRLSDAIDKLDKTTERMSATTDKMINYCTLITILMFITFAIAIIF